MAINKSDLMDYIETPAGRVRIYSLRRINELGLTDLDRLPYTIRILLENIARNIDGYTVREDDLYHVCEWGSRRGRVTIPFKPYRVLMQDYTGVPLIVDLAAMRDLAVEYGLDPRVVDARIRGDLIIDHSVRVDYHGVTYALRRNMELEFRRFRERYELLKWAQNAFRNLRVIPPGKGIIHQVNIEYLAEVVATRSLGNGVEAFPDTLLGTDSHTVMVNGIGVLGWGVGGIEAEAVLLGEPYYMLLPRVIGVRLEGSPREGVTATDIVLSLTEFLRKRAGVPTVGMFIEFYGEGIKYLSGFDRVTIANMAPEYGATTGFFPIDDATLDYLRLTGRSEGRIGLIREYALRQKLFYSDDYDPDFDYRLVFNLDDVEPSISGPGNPEDRVSLERIKGYAEENILNYLRGISGLRVGGRGRADEEFIGGDRGRPEPGLPEIEVDLDGVKGVLSHGSIVLAAITSCTNTSNPYVMIGAGLLARRAVEYGLRVRPWVKTSLAPGSRAVTEYLRRSGLMPYLEALGFHLVGYGCTTCIGNSGPLHKSVEEAIRKYNLYTVSILSGNRNYSGRIHPLVRGNFLASPIMVVAYAIKGTILWDPYREPIGYTPNGEPVYLRDIWLSHDEIVRIIRDVLDPGLMRSVYTDIDRGTDEWERLEAPVGETFKWNPDSTYIRRPPFLEGFTLEPPRPRDIKGARILLRLGDRVTTDHISPAGVIGEDTPAGRYLLEHGVEPRDFGTYGSRRGNHEVMVRGTFANPRLRNMFVDREGGYTIYWPEGKVMTVYDAAMNYKSRNIYTVVLAGKMYGAGSSRDWAAKGPALLGVKAVLAESFERIHRSNLIGMGILPIELPRGIDLDREGLRGDELVDIIGIEEGLEPMKRLRIIFYRDDGFRLEVTGTALLYNEVEVEYYLNGGILPYVMRRIIKRHGGDIG